MQQENYKAFVNKDIFLREYNCFATNFQWILTRGFFMRNRIFIGALIYIVLLTFLSFNNSYGHQGLFIPPEPTPSPINQEIKLAIRSEIKKQSSNVIGYLIYNVQIDHIITSDDLSKAIAWITYIDPQSKTLVNGEPGLAILRQTSNGWTAILPSDQEWLSALQQIPDELLSPDEKQTWISMYAESTNASTLGPFGGYLLPWEGGKSLYLTRSITHYNPPNPNGSMHYAFDFAAAHDSSGTSPMFEIYASKGGRVKYARWWQINGDEHSPGNYIVLEDTTTSPTTYQLYLHLAKDSIPVELRVPGTNVVQGEYLGLADDTGYSTGNHLHFHVHTNPDSYWGNSVDITFDDVPINGGRPRTLYEAQHYPEYGSEGQSTYVSGNQITSDKTPPTGDIFTPEIGQMISSQIWHIEGWATDDDSGLGSVQIIARYNGLWHTISPNLNSNLFTYDWNICDSDIPDGSVSLALRLVDNKGNTTTDYPGLRHLFKQYSCTPEPNPPACHPSANQVAIYSMSNFQGDCIPLGLGDFPNNEDIDLTPFNGIASVQVGDDVFVSLYTKDNFTGRSETISQNDSNLSENIVGPHSTSSLKIYLKQDSLIPPNPILPENNTTITNTQSITLIGESSPGCLSYQFKVETITNTLFSPWLDNPTWLIGSLEPGTYTWSIRGKSQTKQSDWSQSRTVEIIEGQLINLSGFLAPYTDTLEGSTSSWESYGLWNLLDNEEKAHSGTHSWWYGNSTSGSYDTNDMNFGWLTSPPITLPASSSPYVVGFWSWVNTESEYSFWDQRWLQISIDNKPYTNVLQLSSEPQLGWFKYTADLSGLIQDYDTHTHEIRLRFYFNTIDETNNAYEGWRIDDISVFALNPPQCNDSNENNDFYSDATPIAYGETITGDICPTRDFDFFKFTGQQGDRVVVDIDAKSIGSNLDSILYLLDNDGRSILAEHDDEILGIKQDPHLSTMLPRDGTYYLKLNAWDYPQGVGSYNLTLLLDDEKPSISIFHPQTETFLKNNINTIQVNASDLQSGIKEVKFYWHSDNWDTDTWEELGVDQEPEDGWNMDIDASSQYEGEKVIIFAQAYDWAGNWSVDSSWNLVIDKTPPNTAAVPIPDPSDSTAIHLSWSGVDNISGINNYDIRYKRESESWESLEDNLSPSQTDYWMVGESNNNYAFQLRAEDNAGNIETFGDGAYLSTNIPKASDLCQSMDEWDINDLQNDNSPSSATQVTTESAIQTHNFCNPAREDFLYDEDWIAVNLNPGKTLSIVASPLDKSVNVYIRLYDTNGKTLLKESAATTWGQPSEISMQPSRAGTYFVQLTHNDGRVIGDAVSYTVYIGEFNLFFPLINK